jgi:hypothetical protein
MNRYQFTIPVRINPGAGQPVLELYDVEDAADFLVGLPVEFHGPGHQAALDACIAASADALAAEDARWLLVKFGRQAGMLSHDMRVAVDSYGELVPLPVAR